MQCAFENFTPLSRKAIVMIWRIFWPVCKIKYQRSCNARGRHHARVRGVFSIFSDWIPLARKADSSLNLHFGHCVNYNYFAWPLTHLPDADWLPDSINRGLKSVLRLLISSCLIGFSCCCVFHKSSVNWVWAGKFIFGARWFCRRPIQHFPRDAVEL